MRTDTVIGQNGASSSAVIVFFATVFFVAFFAAVFFVDVFFFATFFAGAFFATVFLAGAFFAAFLPNRQRIGLPVSSINFNTSSSVCYDGSRSLGMRPLSLPSLIT